jgi:hypothetical protein
MSCCTVDVVICAFASKPDMSIHDIGTSTMFISYRDINPARQQWTQLHFPCLPDPDGISTGGLLIRVSWSPDFLD